MGDRLCAGEGELHEPRMDPKLGMELACWFWLDGVTEEAGAPTDELRPPPPALWGPKGPPVGTPVGPLAEPG